MRVLILEDDQLIRHALANILATASRDRPIDVDRAGSWAQGRFKIDAQTPDVLLLDLNLEDVGSHAMLPLIPKLSRQMAVIVISNSDSKEVVDRAMKYGAQDFIEKQHLVDNKAVLFERMERAYQRFCAERNHERREIVAMLAELRRNLEELKQS